MHGAHLQIYRCSCLAYPLYSTQVTWILDFLFLSIYLFIYLFFQQNCLRVLTARKVFRLFRASTVQYV